MREGPGKSEFSNGFILGAEGLEKKKNPAEEKEKSLQGYAYVG